jgi:hypothetical protein
VIPFASLAERLLATSERRLPPSAARAVRVPLILTLTAGLQLPSLLARSGSFGGDPRQPHPGSAVARSACDVRAVAGVLADAHGLGRAPAKLLCFTDFSPELLYRTPHSVFAIPNHRPQPGFTLAHRVLDAEPALGWRKLRAAGGELIAICPASPNAALYLGRDNLYSALAAGRPPLGLTELALPAGSGFRLYSLALPSQLRVSGPRSPKAAGPPPEK